MKITLPLIAAVLLHAACNEKEESLNPLPTSVSVSGVKLITMPLTDNGEGWDNVSDADVFFTIGNAQAVLYKHNKVKEDLQNSDLPYSFTMNRYELPLINNLYTLRIYDYDTPDPDDLIGEVHFNPESYKTDRIKTVTLSATGIKAEVYLDWK